MTSRPVFRRPALPPVPALLLAAISIQGGAALAKALFPLLGPPAVTSLRVSFAALILGLIWRPRLRQVGQAGWKALLPYGVALGVMNLTYYLALARIPLGLTVTLEFVGPLTVAVLNSRRASDFVWVGLAALGILLIVPWPGQRGGLDPLGVGLALCAGACWGVYIWAGQRVARVFAGSQRLSGQGVALGMGLAALVTLPFGLISGARHGGGLSGSTMYGAWAQLTPTVLLTALGVAVLSSALPYSLEMGALRTLPARVFGVLMSLEPAVAAVIGLVFLHEHLSVGQGLAIACVMAASVGVTQSGDRKSGTAEKPPLPEV